MALAELFAAIKYRGGWYSAERPTENDTRWINNLLNSIDPEGSNHRRGGFAGEGPLSHVDRQSVPVLHQDLAAIGQLGWLAQPRELSNSTISLPGCKRGWRRSNFVALRLHDMEDHTQWAENPGNVG